jgi:hypothetical protein
MNVVYDAGALIAIDRRNDRMRALHAELVRRECIPLVPAIVVAQASRSPKQVALRMMLRGCEVVPVDLEWAHRIGATLGRAGTRDVVDAAVVTLATKHRARVVSSDPDDLIALAQAIGFELSVVRV